MGRIWPHGTHSPDRMGARSETRLGALRGQITALNGEILALLERRASVVLEIAKVKEACGLDGHDPGREEEMLRDIAAQASGALDRAQIREVFQSIFRVSLEIQDRRRQEGLRVRRRD